MYPSCCLINSESNNFVVFEKDLNNPNNEGFIEFWQIINSNTKQLTFKKRTTKNKALSLLNNLIEEGWKRIEIQKVA